MDLYGNWGVEIDSAVKYADKVLPTIVFYTVSHRGSKVWKELLATGLLLDMQ